MNAASLLLALLLLAPDAAAPPPRPAPRSGPPVVSPEIGADRRVTFRLRAPEAREVAVSGQFGKGKTAMTRDGDGLWSATVGPVEPGLYEYSFTIDGVQVIDPGNPDIKPQRSPRASILEIAGSPPRLTEFQDVPHGIVRVHHYRSKIAGRVRRLHAYTPAEYEKKPSARYPILYLQHGYGDSDGAWTVHGRAHFILDNLIAQGKARPMVVVMMDGHPVPPEGPPDPDRLGKNTQVFGRELIEEVMPLVESTYRVRPEAQSRALVGLSMGGNQALTVGLNHADRFAWVGGFSSAPPAEAAVAAALGDGKALAKKLRWLWIGCGKEDFLLKRNQDFLALLRSRGIEPIWRLTEGGHAWPVWREYLAEVAPALFAPAPKR